MKLVNSRGRVLLEVTGATAKGIDAGGFVDTTYQYTGDGCGGNATLVGLHNTIKAICMDAPSAKLVGMLPTPEIWNGLYKEGKQ